MKQSRLRRTPVCPSPHEHPTTLSLGQQALTDQEIFIQTLPIPPLAGRTEERDAGGSVRAR